MYPLELLGGSRVVISGVFSPLIWVIITVTLLITPLITPREPPSMRDRIEVEVRFLYQLRVRDGVPNYRASTFRIRLWVYFNICT